MFTGIIQDVGEIARINRSGNSAQVWVRTALDVSGFVRGESIAVSGVCLTVTETQGDTFRVDASSESFTKTTLGEAVPGRKVNIERAMRADDRFGGHFVLGHVDGVGRVREARREGEYLRFVVAPPPELMRYMVSKGSVAVDGVSLTINSVDADSFSLMLIPTTLSETTLVERKVGDTVNIETDIIGKHIERFIKAGSGGLTIDKLREEGWE